MSLKITSTDNGLILKSLKSKLSDEGQYVKVTGSKIGFKITTQDYIIKSFPNGDSFDYTYRKKLFTLGDTDIIHLTLIECLNEIGKSIS
jgi:hypothetical protein